MVSLQRPNSPNDQRKAIPELFEVSSKKRSKWEEEAVLAGAEENFEKRLKNTTDNTKLFFDINGRSKAENPKPLFYMEHQMERPRPLEWQKCLHIQSGQTLSYNTSTQKNRTCSKGPRQNPEWSSSTHRHMSLDLELNLPCGSLQNQEEEDGNRMKHESNNSPSDNSSETSKNSNTGEQKNLTRCPSWVSLEEDQQEMVTAVCMRCHMLVMLCKSSPTCPNCKFMHPTEQSPPNLFGFRLLCCKD